jgi:hypothetical protein
MKRETAQAKKDRIITGLIEARRAILDAATSLPRSKRDQVFLGVWSTTDLLAHLVGWDATNLEAAREILAGKVPAFFSHYDAGWKTYKARLVKKHKRGSFAEMVASVGRSHRKLTGLLETIPAGEFGKDRGLRSPGGAKVILARLLQAEIDDEKVHAQQIEDFD